MTAELPGLLPVGRGTVEAEPLTSAAGDHALLLRQAGAPRLLLVAEPGDVAQTGRERIVVVPFDGDALATWIAAPELSAPDPARAGVPAWASALGFVLIILVVVLTMIGGAFVFGWILDAAGA
jgi:hypothetical protein